MGGVSEGLPLRAFGLTGGGGRAGSEGAGQAGPAPGQEPRSTGPQCAGKPSLYFWECNSPHFPSYLTFSLLRPSTLPSQRTIPGGLIIGSLGTTSSLEHVGVY